MRKMERDFIWILAGLMVIGLLGATSISLAVEDTWTRKADMPTARSGPSTSAVNGKIYAIGGYVGGGAPVSTVEEYDTGFVPPQETEATTSVEPKGKLVIPLGEIKSD